MYSYMNYIENELYANLDFNIKKLCYINLLFWKCIGLYYDGYILNSIIKLIRSYTYI